MIIIKKFNKNKIYFAMNLIVINLKFFNLKYEKFGNSKIKLKN